MKIIKGYPPNFDKIDAAFHVRGRHGILYAYDGDIYNPSGVEVTGDIISHESVHFKQQEVSGGAVVWWERYIESPAFRLSQELEAYRCQYAYVRAFHNRRTVDRLLDHFAMTLSGPIYGGLTNYHDAKKAILASN